MHSYLCGRVSSRARWLEYVCSLAKANLHPMLVVSSQAWKTGEAVWSQSASQQRYRFTWAKRLHSSKASPGYRSMSQTCYDLRCSFHGWWLSEVFAVSSCFRCSSFDSTRSLHKQVCQFARDAKDSHLHLGRLLDCWSEARPSKQSTACLARSLKSSEAYYSSGWAYSSHELSYQSQSWTAFRWESSEQVS